MKNVYLLLRITFMGVLFVFFSCNKDQNFGEEVQMQSASDDFITEQQAIVLAERFIGGVEPSLRSSAKNLKVVYTDLGSNISTRSAATNQEDEENQKPTYYVINVDTVGYVIVSASDVTLPILGYSTESVFSPENIPINMESVLSGYKEEILYVRTLKMRQDATIKKVREDYLSGVYQTTQTRAATEVKPLLGTIKWNQRPYYNTYCPANCPVGCVATATCQIMRYWQYPASGTGTHSYRSSYGTLSFNYNYTLNWSQMPKERLVRSNNEVAKFCYGVAVGVNMSFSPNGSGAYQESVPGMLKKFYRYPSSVENRDRRYYSASVWTNMIREELSAGRPVQYAGYGSGGGHSFVCDGYDARGYFHFNWGWGGMSDGYFLLSALNPGSLGTGGGSGGFNSGHTIIVGFQPPGGGNGNGGGNPNPDDPDNEPTPQPVENYCDSKSLSYSYMYIRYVKMNEMVNYSSGNNYSDFTAKKVYAKAGDRVYFQFAPGYSYYTYRAYWRAWVDLNNNKQFDNNEKFAEQYSAEYFNGSFVIPYNTPKGEYRVRVSVSNSGYPGPCETFNHGEVEDYTLVVQ